MVIATCPNCGMDYETAGELRAWKDALKTAQLKPLAYCAQLEYQDEHTHHVHPHPPNFTSECEDCASRLALLRRAVAL